MEWRDKITCDPNVMMGKAILKGTRIPVAFVLELFANGWARDQVLQNYPQLTAEDIQAVFAYSSARLKDEEVVPLKFGT